jgi:hypothetical protein
LTLLALLDFPIIAEVRQQPKQPVDRSNAVSHRQREEMVDCGEGDQQGDAQPQASADQLLLDRQQRLGLGGAQFLADVVVRHDGAFPVQPTVGGVIPPKNSQEIASPTQITKREMK